ncbi:MAG TPA: SMI1/KNR4 family protein [Mycobacteriales bacterium]|nr:SMI1/KNR4 family protein [Mycobacteriales bacterium]
MAYDELARLVASSEDAEHGKGSSPEHIKAAEETLGVRFPSEYVHFLGDFGWLAIGAAEIFGLGEDAPPYLDVVGMTLAERRDQQPSLPNNLVPVMNDGGGNLYCLDCASPGGSIVLWGHVGEMREVCVSFSRWLMGVVEVDSIAG